MKSRVSDDPYPVSKVFRAIRSPNAATSETRCSASGIRQIGDMLELYTRRLHNNKLRNAIACFDDELVLWIQIYKNHFDFASVATVDEARRVYDRDAVVEC